MYAITGATGNTGRHIAAALLDAGKAVRVTSRSADKLAEFTAKGAQSAVGSLEDAGFLEGAFEGAEAVYAMIPPDFSAENYREYQNRVADAFVKAVRAAGVRYVVTLSSVGAHLPEKGGVVQGLYDMEQKFGRLDGVHVLHLRPGYFMENLLAQVPLIKQMGIIGSPIKADLSFPMVATRDIADVAIRRLLGLDFQGGSVQYVLGPRDVTFAETASVIGQAIGKRDLKYVEFPYEEFGKAMIAQAGMSPSVADALVEFTRGMNDGRVLSAVRRTPESTTPTSIEEFAGVFAQVYAG